MPTRGPIQVGVMANYPTQRAVTKYQLFPFNGQTGDNYTGATLMSMAAGPAGVLVVGTSIPQPNAPTGPRGTTEVPQNVWVAT